MSVYEKVKQERARQDRIWGGPSHDDTHNPRDWCMFLDEQLDKAFDNASNDEVDRNKTQLDALEWQARMIKIAALAIAAVQSYNKDYD